MTHDDSCGVVIFDGIMLHSFPQASEVPLAFLDVFFIILQTVPVDFPNEFSFLFLSSTDVFLLNKVCLMVIVSRFQLNIVAGLP